MSSRIKSLIASCVASLGFFVSLSSSALSAPSESGELDQRFGDGGILSVGFGNGAHLSPEVWGGTIQTDGKIVVVGQERLGTSFLVHRFHTDGSSDTTFGEGGSVVTEVEVDSFGQAFSVAIQADGKILVCGQSETRQGSSLVLVRHEQDGSLDSSFGDGGILLVTSSGGNYVSSSELTLLNDGRILVATTIDRGAGTRLDVALLQFNEDGQPDLSFGNGGVAFHDLGGLNNDFAADLAVQTDGRIVVTGGSLLDLFVARFNADGTIDQTFGIGGVVFGTYGLGSFGAEILVQGDGKIVVGGCSNCFQSDLQDMVILRLNSDGSFDGSFGSNGATTIDVASRDSVDGLAIQSQERIVVSGTTFFDNEADFVTARLLKDGSLDTTFAGDGIRVTDFGGSDESSTMILGSEDSILQIGDSRDNGSRIAMARYDRHGNLDPTFDEDGLVTETVLGPTSDSANDIVVQSNGRIVTAGRSSIFVGQGFAIARTHRNGTPDASFGTDGRVTTFFPTHGSSGAESLAIQPDGKIVVAGSGFNPTTRDDFVLARYQPDGSLDPTFDNDGWATTDLQGQDDDCRSVAIQANGKIVAAGRTELDGTRNIALVRYDRWGQVDASFGTDGTVIVQLGETESDLREIAIHPSGDIYGVGFAGEFMIVVRISSDGVLLNQTILTFQNFFGETGGHALAIQRDGRILVAGSTDRKGDEDFAIARLLPSLQLDPTFGQGGEVVAGWVGRDDSCRSLVLAEGGLIVMVGESEDGPDDEFAALLLRTDGSIRTDFQMDGWILTNVNNGDGGARSGAIDSSGGLLIAGDTGGVSSDFAIARYFFQPRLPQARSFSLGR